MTLTIAIEEHWMLPDLTSALKSMPEHLRDDSLVFNERGDNQQRRHPTTSSTSWNGRLAWAMSA